MGIKYSYKNLSIFTFINIIFAITLILAIAFVSFYIKIDKQQYKQTQVQRYELITNRFISKLSTIKNKEQLLQLEKKINISYIKEKNFKLDILKNGQILYQKELRNIRIRAFFFKNKYYVYVQSLGFNLMFEDKNKINYNISFVVFSSFVIFILLIILYIMIYKKLKPLKELNNSIKQFSNGDFTTAINIYSMDEIGQISSTFNDAIKNISYLIESKTLFMRNIMHELKTPITKSLFLISMIDTSNNTNKKELEECLYDMDSILKQLSNIEKYQVNFTNIVKEKLDLKIMIKETTDIKILYNDDYTLIANKELMAIVFKNLIENGIKYSKDKKIFVDIDDTIKFKSLGNKLIKDLKYYTQPFTQGKKNNDGFGLGLYIVSEILKLHKLELKYNYENGYNIFYI